MEKTKRLRKNNLRLDDKPKGVWRYLIIITIFSLIIIVPYLVMFSEAFKNTDGKFSLVNWQFLYKRVKTSSGEYLPPAGPSLLTSLEFALCMMIGVVGITIPAAYAMARTSFPGRRFLARLLIILDAFPSVALLTTYVFLLSKLHLTNKLAGVFFLKVAMYVPSCIWLMKGFFDHVSWDIEWASIVDGASRFKTMRRIILPQALPGISVIAVNSFLNGWGEFILINLFIYGKTTTMSSLIGAMYNWDNMSYNVEQGVLAAACLIYIIPVIVVFALSQETLLQVKQGGSKQ